MKIQFAFIFTLLGLQGVAQSVVVANKTFLQVDKTVECHEEVVLSGIGTSSCISTICTVIEEGGDVLAIFDGLNIYDAKGRVINEGRDFRTQSVSSQSITAITGDFGVNLYHLGFENFAMRPLYVSKLSFVNGELEIVGKNEFILEGDFAYLKSITNSLGRSSLLVYDIGGEELITSDVTDGELSDLKRHNLVLDGFNSSGRDDLGALAVSNQGNQLFLT
ncbi:MAG: hypothetical protein AB8F74_01790, partial [Saprospiraceae bacterium]